jgi:sulfur-oxidizing protein SoxZ
MARALIHMPATARRGEIIEIRALVSHPMETGYRAGNDGKVLPRDIIRRFSCRYNGELVFAAELHPAIAANPYIAFFTVATESGTLAFSWEGDHGFAHAETMAITVSAA